MADKRGRKPRTPATDIHALTGLTYDELAALQADLEDMRVDAFPGFFDELGMTHGQLVEHLNQGKFQFYVPAPLFEKLKQLVARLQRPWSPEEVKRYRWDWVRRALDAPHLNLSYEGACRIASHACQGGPAAAGPGMMGQAYRELEKALPKGERRPRTYRKRPCLTPAERECRDARGPEERLAALKMSIQEVAGDDPEHFEKALIRYLKAVKHLEVETLCDLTGPAFGAAVEAIAVRRNARPVEVYDAERAELAKLQHQERKRHLVRLLISAGK